MFKIINMRLSNDLFRGAHVSKTCHTLSAALKMAEHLFEEGILDRDQTCIPVRGMGVAAVVFSAEGARSLESRAREFGFFFLDIHRLTTDGGLVDLDYEFDAEKGFYVEGEPQAWEPELLDHALERLKPTNKENSYW